MKRLLLLVFVLLPAALLAPAAAAAAETQTIHFSGTDSRAELNLCSGVPGTLTIVYSGVVHTTDPGDGTLYMTGTTTGAVTFVPDDPSQPGYTGHLTEQSGQGTGTITIADNIVLHGSDGSLGKLHILFHLTMNANGTVTASIDTDQLSC
jgi:hypothetical protein